MFPPSVYCLCTEGSVPLIGALLENPDQATELPVINPPPATLVSLNSVSIVPDASAVPAAMLVLIV